MRLRAYCCSDEVFGFVNVVYGFPDIVFDANDLVPNSDGRYQACCGQASGVSLHSSLH